MMVILYLHSSNDDDADMSAVRENDGGNCLHNVLFGSGSTVFPQTIIEDTRDPGVRLPFTSPLRIAVPAAPTAPRAR